MLKLLKRIAPVGIAIVLVFLITITVTLIQDANDRTPEVSNSDKVYVSYKDLTVTNEKIYNLMKNQYGLAELLNMVDGKLFEKEVNALDVNDPAYLEFINEQVFGTKDPSELDAEEAQEIWDGIIDSLRITGQLTAAQAKDKDYTKNGANNSEESAVWTSVKSHYKLSYVREEWAKAEYIKKHLENREDGNMFDMTEAENAVNSVEKYFNDNYKGSVTGFFIPFTSEKAALEMMKKHGINTHDKVLGANDGWVSSSYDYFSQVKVEEKDMLSYTEVLEAFFKMYNEVYSYLNEGKDIITTDTYTKELKVVNTIQAIILAVQKQLEDNKYGTTVTLPSVVTVDGEGEATLTWSVDNEKFGKVEENVLTGIFDNADDGELEIKLSFKVEYKDETRTGNIAIDLEGVLNESTNEWEPAKDTVATVDPITAQPFYTYQFTEAFLNANANEEGNFKFQWTYEEASEFNSTLANYLSVDSTNLKLSEKPKEAYKSYTIEPVKVGNYYCLILKLADHEQTELFEKDADGENAKNDKGEYIIADEALYNEIVEKMTEELLTDNAINEMLYEKRQAHNLQFFDSYIEALYEYEYNYFYKTTLKANEFDEYKKSTKNQTKLIASAQKEAGNKKGDKIEFTAQDLFEKLEPKYGASSVATLVENYILVADKELNNIYNPYTEEILNESQYKNLMNSEISTLRKNFDRDYFTFESLAYYGFTPNFSAKYGWKQFIKDYFVVYSDQELLTSSTYGGSIYADALAQYIDNAYTIEEIYNKMVETHTAQYSVTVTNLLVTLDYDYNADDANQSNNANIMAEADNWKAETAIAKTQNEYAVELLNYMYEWANQTNGATLVDQLKALVALYNEAAYEYDETSWENALAQNKSVYDYNYFGKYKLVGLNITVQANTNITQDSAESGYDETFCEEAKLLWDEVNALNLLGIKLDAPIIQEKPFLTEFGYHKLAVETTAEKKALPEKAELIKYIEFYRAQTLVNNVQTEIDELDKTIDTYLESGYDVSSQEAQRAYLEYKLEKYEALLDEVCEKYSLESDYELDDEVQAIMKDLYTPVETELEGGTLVTRKYIEAIKQIIADNAIEYGEIDKLAEFLDLLKEQCDKADKITPDTEGDLE